MRGQHSGRRAGQPLHEAVTSHHSQRRHSPPRSRWIEALRRRQGNRYNPPPITRSGPIDTVILGDSLCKYVDEIRHTQVFAFPGINSAQLEQLVLRDKLRVLENKRVILVHVGTNDLDLYWSDTVFVVCRLLTTLGSKYPHSKIIWSNILPRPAPTYYYDRETVRKNIIKINNCMKSRQRHLGFYTCPSHTSFHKSKYPTTKLYAIDYLHLKRKGTFLLRELFRQHLIRLRDIWGMEVWQPSHLEEMETIIDWNWHAKLCGNSTEIHY